MSTYREYESARTLLKSVRLQQRALLEEAASDGNGRTLGTIEAEEYSMLETEAKSLELEVQRLDELVQIEAAAARPPRSSLDAI